MAVVGAGLLLGMPALAAEGELDDSFSGDGKRLIAFDLAGDTLQIDQAFGIAVQDDGKVVVVGRAESDAGPALAWSRTTASGNSDLGFAGGGATLRPAGCAALGDMRLVDVVVADDGVIWAAGWCETATSVEGRVLRIDPANGVVLTTVNVVIGATGPTQLTRLEAIALSPGGKVVVAGTGTGEEDRREFGVARLTAAGAFDPTFSGTGKRTVRFSEGHAFGYDVTVQPDGTVIAVGDVETASGGSLAAFVFLTSSGDPAPSAFTDDGAFAFGSNSPGVDWHLRGVALRKKGGFVFGGTAVTPGAVPERRCITGLAVPQSIGVFTSNAFPGLSCEGADVASQSDGKILLAGFVQQADSSYDFAVLRLVGTQLDPAFPPNATALAFDGVPGGDDYAHAVAIVPGHVVVAGEAELSATNSDFAVARLKIALLFADSFETGDTLEWAP